MSRFFYDHKVRDQARLLDTLNDVIGPIEKILEALEKKFHLKIHIFQKFRAENRMVFFTKIVKKITFPCL